MKSRNFLRFMGYRHQQITIDATHAHGGGSSNKVDLTAGADGFGDIVFPGEAGHDLIITVTCKTNQADGRGTKYTKDAVTGKTFAGFGTDTNTDDCANGDVTRIHSDDISSVGASDGVITLAAVSGADGYKLLDGDLVDVHSYYGAGDLDTKIVKQHSYFDTDSFQTSTAYTQSDGIVVPAANFLGVDPISNTTTRVSFKSMLGTAVDDDILIFHNTGMFKEVCEALHHCMNAEVNGGQAITFCDYPNGIQGPAGFDLGITECHITYAT